MWEWPPLAAYITAVLPTPVSTFLSHKWFLVIIPRFSLFSWSLAYLLKGLTHLCVSVVSFTRVVAERKLWFRWVQNCFGRTPSSVQQHTGITGRRYFHSSAHHEVHAPQGQRGCLLTSSTLIPLLSWKAAKRKCTKRPPTTFTTSVATSRDIYGHMHVK